MPEEKSNSPDKQKQTPPQPKPITRPKPSEPRKIIKEVRKPQTPK